MNRLSAALLVASTCGSCLVLAGCGSGDQENGADRAPLEARTVRLTAEEREVWSKRPPDRTAIPVLLYHGIGPADTFANAADAEYGISVDDFAKQLTMIAHAGFQTVDLPTFRSFVRGEQVALPPRPLLLTFDDARLDSWTGGDAILAKLGFTAVMFVDVGRVEAADSEYLTWQELERMEESGRWQLQLHSGEGHHFIRVGPGPDDTGPFYAYREEGETFDGWRERVFSDLTWGEEQLAARIASYRPLAFAPPYGAYGQEGTNDPRIPETLLAWLTRRFGLVFTQDESFFVRPKAHQPLGRLQITRAMTGGELHKALVPAD